MTIYPVRERARSYGHAIGVLMLDEAVPFIPGSVGNASSYPYPVLFRAVSGLKYEDVFARDPGCTALLVDAARELEAEGVKGIAGNCGFMLGYQETVAAAVSVPVFLSSLMQLPLVAASLGRGQSLGIIAADEDGITPELLALAGLDGRVAIVAKGMKAMPAFRHFLVDMRGSLDAERVREETVAVARQLVSENDGVGAILLECSELPPYAHAVQQATGLPTYDFMTLIGYFAMGATRTPYSGAY